MVQLRLPGYEGPLQLLLELIEKRELAISELSLIAVTDQYLEQVEHLKAGAGDELAHALAEFIDIGGRLILLKSRELIPRPAESEAGEDDDASVGSELVAMLEEYRLYRDAVGELEGRDRSGRRSFPLAAPPPVTAPEPVGLPDSVTLDLLTKLVRDAMARAAERERTEKSVALQRDPFTVRSKMSDLRQRLGAGGQLSFRNWIADARTRVEVIVTFLAILELYKSRAVELGQDDTYGDIVIRPREDAPESAWLPSAEEAPDEAAATAES